MLYLTLEMSHSENVKPDEDLPREGQIAPFSVFHLVVEMIQSSEPFTFSTLTPNKVSVLLMCG